MDRGGAHRSICCATADRGLNGKSDWVPVEAKGAVHSYTEGAPQPAKPWRYPQE